MAIRRVVTEHALQFTFQNTDILVNMRTEASLMDEVRRRLLSGEGFALATVNLDHLVKMSTSPDFTRVYAKHDLVVADGWPIVALSRLARKPVDLMPGSDMILPLCQMAVETRTPIALVGSTEETLETAARELAKRVPGLVVVLTISPPMGFDPAGETADEIFERLSSSSAGLCFLALGAPKQEAMAARGREKSPTIGFASIGAGLDFLSGRQHRAPRWVQRIGMEWLWRALSSPRRLIPRYARCFAILPGQITAALRQRQG